MKHSTPIIQGDGENHPPSRAQQIPLTSILCSELRLRSSWPLADSVPPKGRGRGKPASQGRFRRRSSSHGGHYGGQAGGAYIRFCETNPPIFGAKTWLIYQASNVLRRKNFGKNGGFVLENEPTGRGF